MLVYWTGSFPLIQASSNAAAHQMPEIQGAQHKQARERPNVPGAHGSGRKCCRYSCAPTVSGQGCSSSHRVSQKRATPPSVSSRETRHQPCREPKTVSALIPTSCSCTLGSVSAENTTEQTGAWSDSRVLSSGGRGMESLPVTTQTLLHTLCSDSTPTALDRPFLGCCI